LGLDKMDLRAQPRWSPVLSLTAAGVLKKLILAGLAKLR
jgi:hypothetical protein